MNENYVTQSLYEAAFLMARGCVLAGKDKSGEKVGILFENSKKTEIEALNYYNLGMVEAKRYADCYRTLKDYIFTR